MPEDSLDGDLTKTGSGELGVAEPSLDLQRWPHRRRIERLEASLDGLLTRLSQVEGEHQNAVDIGPAIRPLAARFDRIEARAAAEIPGLTPDLDGLISLRVAVTVDGRLAELAAARGVPQPAGGERLDRIEQALAELACRLGEVEGCQRWRSARRSDFNF
jgi:hypothetical protein